LSLGIKGRQQLVDPALLRPESSPRHEDDGADFPVLGKFADIAM
jgi:hypothetical protein